MTSIISWNVNGLRALYRKGQFDWILKENPDIFCIQEIKASPDQLPAEVREPTGYLSYFNTPKEKKGYSGVATYTKIQPKHVSHEMGIATMDSEGRLLVTEFEATAKNNGFILINCYFPNGGGAPERLRYKLDFYDYFLDYVEKLHEKQPNILICGDVNVAHRVADIARPKENETHVGFLPIERAWMDKVVSKDWIDVFRHFYPNEANRYTYWDQKSFARERNVGWRIDYFLASKSILQSIESIEILDQILGSDHCPIKVTLKDS